MHHTMQIPKAHKAVVYDKPGDISTRIVELDTPAPGPGQILVKMYVEYFFCRLGTLTITTVLILEYAIPTLVS